VATIFLVFMGCFFYDFMAKVLVFGQE